MCYTLSIPFCSSHAPPPSAGLTWCTQALHWHRQGGADLSTSTTMEWKKRWGVNITNNGRGGNEGKGTKTPPFLSLSGLRNLPWETGTGRTVWPLNICPPGWGSVTKSYHGTSTSTGRWIGIVVLPGRDIICPVQMVGHREQGKTMKRCCPFEVGPPRAFKSKGSMVFAFNSRTQETRVGDRADAPRTGHLTSLAESISSLLFWSVQQKTLL